MRFELRLTNRWFVYHATLLEVVLGHTLFFCLVVVTKSLLLLCQSHERRRRRIAVVVVVVLELLLFVDRSNPFHLFLRLPFRAL